MLILETLTPLTASLDLRINIIIQILYTVAMYTIMIVDVDSRNLDTADSVTGSVNQCNC